MAVRSKWMRTVAASVATVAVLLTAGCTGARGAAESPFDQVDAAIGGPVAEELEAALTEAMERSGSSGAIAGVWAPWAGGWTAAIGTTTRDGDTPVTTDMSFRAGLITTGMACTVLLRLVDEGKVQLNQQVGPVVKVPGLEGITFAQLCQQTSGLGDYYEPLRRYLIENPGREWPAMELLASGLARDRAGEPGEKWAYSRTATVLLGIALEELTHTDFADLVARYVSGPLELGGTALPAASDLDLPGAHAAGLVAPRGAESKCTEAVDVSNLSSSAGFASFGVISDLEDLRVWSRALATSSLLSEQSASAQWATVPRGSDAESWVSYGLGADEYGPMRGVASEIPGSLTAAYADPDTGLTVVIALNNSTSGTEFVRSAALMLASIGSKADAADGREMPLVELPWSAEQMQAAMSERGVCEPAAAEESADEG
ncbi:serine hydrolase domain-containing protein [Agromyces sp. SYSU T00194]|uniref:serine hydrolase domain-containing protein n=1 Tax=Agromyces chitinivorans TaxID=3158560 RepID=UPI003395565A